MRLCFVFVTLTVVLTAGNIAKSSNTANNQTPVPAQTIGKVMVCKAQFRRRTSHVPYQVVRSFLAVVRCPNEFFSTDFN